MRHAILPAALVISTLGCSFTPNGWTSSCWNDFAAKDPEAAEAVRFIQKSAKRQKQLDIFMASTQPNLKNINQHYYGVKVVKNEFTGKEIYVVDFAFQKILNIMAMPSSKKASFSKLLVQCLGIEAEERNMQFLRTMAVEANNDPAIICDPPIAQQIIEVEAKIKKLKATAREIERLGD